MRANEKNLIITPYAEYNHLDISTIKIKEPNHLFDVDPSNRKSNKRPYVDRDAVTTNVSFSNLILKQLKIFLFNRQQKLLQIQLFNHQKLLIMYQ